MSVLPDLACLTSAEKDALILAQAEMIATLQRQCAALAARVAELEAKLGVPPKTPDNSSTPPSKGQKPSTPAPSPEEGKRKPHLGAHRPLHKNPTAKRDVLAAACQHCGAAVSQSPQSVCEAYDHIEIVPIAPHVTRVSLFGGLCPCCRRSFKAEAPLDMPKGSPFGDQLRALVIYLRFTQGIAFERLSTLLSDLFGLDISEGALVNMFEAARKPFAAQRSAIQERLLASTCLESDETGLRVGKANWWLWVFHHKDSAVFLAKPSRAKAVVEEFLGAARPDYWVSDRYGGQMGWATKDHQVCLAHLIRDVQYAIDCGDHLFAPDLRHLLGRACRIGRRRDRLSDATLKSYESRLDTRLDELMTRTPSHPAGVKLQNMIKRTRRHLFVFLTNRDLPATNNASERALRPCAVFRKITNGFRTEWGASLYADIRSVIETARRRAINALEAIRFTLAGKNLSQASA